MHSGNTDGNFLTYINSSEIYSPTTGRWTNTAFLNQARDNFQMVLLPNGNVLAAGGGEAVNTDFSSSELHNPILGIWTTTGPLNTARFQFCMVVLANGNVLAV